MKLCKCCGRPVAITPASRVRPMITTHLYALLFECFCQNTLCVVIWEAPEDEESAETDADAESEAA